MKVQHLLNYLSCLQGPLCETGGSKAANDLASACESLNAFGDMKVEDFAAFLKLAEHYKRTGEVPVTAGRKKVTKKAADPERIKKAAQTVSDLYEKSIDRSLDYATIEAELKKINKDLSAPEMKTLCKEVNIATVPKTKKDAFEAIKGRIFDRKQSFERTAF
ncbi:hypothetical protein [Stratiformator vulcanicus]|uniref:Uncharacterized protein n=1 Tax=Stratiformator vulcanicus TaxID=2527980 RepID=A0A517R1H5_9PLAN|nr:hypothetical protein [Stratiformator vulcanicus]QDT37712.1 hypothetical protein Pan189_20940 [Stratiformator vulcanicus]